MPGPPTAWDHIQVGFKRLLLEELEHWTDLSNQTLPIPVTALAGCFGVLVTDSDLDAFGYYDGVFCLVTMLRIDCFGGN